MWSASERDAVMMDMLIEAKARNRKLIGFPFSPPDLETVMRDVVRLKSSGTTFMRSYRKGLVTTYLQDVDIMSDASGKRYGVLLVALSDQRRPDDVVSNPKQGVRRENTKDASEGNEYSYHIVFSLRPNKAGGHRYRLANEVVPLIPSIYVARFIRFLLDAVSREMGYTRPHPSGKRHQSTNRDDQVGIVVKSSLHAVPSDELLKDLKNGVLATVELSKESDSFAGWDEGKYTREQKALLVLKPKVKAQNANVLDVLKSVCSTGAKNDYTIAKMNWKAADGRSVSAKFDCDSASPLDQRYVRRHTFVLGGELPASCEKIDSGFSHSLINWIK